MQLNKLTKASLGSNSFGPRVVDDGAISVGYLNVGRAPSKDHHHAFELDECVSATVFTKVNSDWAQKFVRAKRYKLCAEEAVV